MKTRVGTLTIFFAALLASSYALALTGEKLEVKGEGPPPLRQSAWTFDENSAGGPPAGAEVFSGDWAIRPEPDAPSPPNVLCQTAESPFPALMLGGEEYKDVTLSTWFKPISGRSDQAAGILFRIRDPDNYYIVRANALEDNVNLYKYENGRRSLIQENNAKVASGQWQELMVKVVGDQIRAFLQGQSVLDARDGTFKTGKVGLWTKADSQTCFDDITVIGQ
jgi:3-keto-disaccharide hydrolase